MADEILDVPEGMAKVQCITELRPWASVNGKDLRPLNLDEVAIVPRAEAEVLKKHRHAVEIR